jgi:hypothetical protein
VRLNDLDRAIQNAFDELDPVQMEVFRRMSPAEKIQIVSGMHNSMRKMLIASEREMHPDLSEDEIHRRAIARLMRASEWEPELRKTIFGL